MNDDFYIGYDPETPASLARRIRRVAIGAVGLAGVVAVTLVLTQTPFATGVFEYGHERTFEGLLSVTPYPALSLEPDSRPIWLVGSGKHGAAGAVDSLDGRKVRVVGTLIERDGERMLQVEASGISALPSPVATLEPLHEVGPMTIEGEIVDGKCHLGVMKPGEGPVHRDCAVRCLLGGVPPLLVVRDAGRSGARKVPLVDLDGSAFSLEVDRWVGRPVRIRGVLYRRGATEYLGVDHAGVAAAR